MLPPFLLGHGAWHGKWCWQPLQRALEQRGAVSVAIDLPGHGEDRGNAWRVTWSDYVARVCAAAAGMSPKPILVGHSMGGGIISAAAGIAPGAAAGLIYVAAFVPADGDTILKLASKGAKPPGLKLRALRGDSIFAPENARDNFFHDCDDPDHWARLVQPQPMRPVLTRIRLPARPLAGISRSYIAATQDRAIPFTLQHIMAQAAGISRISDMESGHSPFLSHPHELADRLIALASQDDG